MKAVLFAIIGVFLYATQNILLDQKLRPYSTAAVVLFFYCATAPLALALLAKMHFSGEAIRWPTGPGLWYALGAGIVFFLADYFYVAAYNGAGGNVFAVTVCAALMPVFIAGLSLLLTRTSPNAWQLAGIGFAIIAVVLVANGSPAIPPPQ